MNSLLKLICFLFIFCLLCCTRGQELQSKNINNIFDETFHGREKHSAIWNRSDEFASFRKYEIYYARSALLSSRSKERNNDLFLFIDRASGKQYKISAFDETEKNIDFILYNIRIDHFNRALFLGDFCKLITCLRLLPQQDLLDARHISTKHIFKDPDISIKNQITPPSVIFITNSAIKVTFFTSDIYHDVRQHEVSVTWHEGVAAIGEVISRKIGHFVEFADIREK